MSPRSSGRALGQLATRDVAGGLMHGILVATPWMAGWWRSRWQLYRAWWSVIYRVADSIRNSFASLKGDLVHCFSGAHFKDGGPVTDYWQLYRVLAIYSLVETGN